VVSVTDPYGRILGFLDGRVLITIIQNLISRELCFLRQQHSANKFRRHCTSLQKPFEGLRAEEEIAILLPRIFIASCYLDCVLWKEQNVAMSANGTLHIKHLYRVQQGNPTIARCSTKIKTPGFLAEPNMNGTAWL
jgi:hypothetical protein